MPRRARLSVPGIPWHVIQRGNNRSPCFYADDDYHRYLDILTEQADKSGCAVHAYVLMTNHVHMLLTPVREDSVALLMKHLGQRYVWMSSALRLYVKPPTVILCWVTAAFGKRSPACWNDALLQARTGGR